MPSLLTAPIRLAGTLLRAALGTPGRAQSPEPEATTPARTTTAADAAAPQPRGRAGKHDQALLEVVHADPGITVAQAAAQLGVHPTAVYPVLRRLEARGELVKRGRELHPG